MVESTDMEQQVSKLVEPFQRVLANGVRKKGFHPVAISHAMMIAGMVELLDAAGKEFTLEILHDMVIAVEDDNGKDLLQ